MKARFAIAIVLLASVLAAQAVQPIRLHPDNRFDNVYFEVCNEPHERDGVTEEWNNLIIDAVVETEAALPNEHLNRAGFSKSISGRLLGFTATVGRQLWLRRRRRAGVFQ
jgi:hypothetical protein